MGLISLKGARFKLDMSYVWQQAFFINDNDLKNKRLKK